MHALCRLSGSGLYGGIRLLRHCERSEAIHGMKQPAVYILSSQKNGTLYTGVTSDLLRRVYEHRQATKSKFASKYRCQNLVYYVCFETMEAAILEEKRIKGGNRKNKLKLIESMNPEWRDLYEDIA